jgi:phospholipase/carboxylesterase
MTMTPGRFTEISHIVLRVLEDIEKFQRNFFPPEIRLYQEVFEQNAERLRNVRKELSGKGLPGILNRHAEAIAASVSYLITAFDFLNRAANEDFQNAMLQAMKAFRKHCRAQELIFQNRTVSPVLNRYFLEPDVYETLDAIDPNPPGENTGLFHIGDEKEPYARGSFSFYIPESYRGQRAWPVVMALHGGFSHGRDFIWSWIREARSRQFFVIAPSSKGSTWSLFDPEADLQTMASALETVSSSWNIDPESILLTGISDGGTFTLAAGMQEHSPYSAYAPLSCSLPPLGLMHVKDRQFYWVHGDLDWMFPIQQTQKNCNILKQAGADIQLKIVRGLSHTYPREENEGILKWFRPEQYY